MANYIISLSNRSCVFDSKECGSIEEAVKYALHRGGWYKVFIEDIKGNTITASHYDKESFAVDIDGWGEVKYFSADEFVSYVKNSMK